jgi:hypothetical protein
MLDTVISNLIRQQRPYYLPNGNPITGVGGQYWLVFQHRDADRGGFFKNIVSMLGFKGKAEPHRIIRIDPGNAKIHIYHLRKAGDLPSPTIFRTANPKIIERFLLLEVTQKESSLLTGSFREIRNIKRRYSLPDQIDAYNDALAKLLERASIYRRSTAYFDSGVLKLYEEPLQAIVQTEGQIRLLMDWKGFTKRTDIKELEWLLDLNQRAEFVQLTLQEFLQGLEESAFTGTQIMAELVRLGFLQIKLIQMDENRAIYHKKTGIFSDRMDNSVLHEGSDNFTRAAHSRNAESVIFLKSWDSLEDQETIQQSIDEFDSEWQRQDITEDLSQEFLRQVLQEYDRRTRSSQPKINEIAPDVLDPGTTTEVTITGENLDQVDSLTVPGNALVDVTITEQTPEQLKADVTVAPDHPPQPITTFATTTKTGETQKHQPQCPPQVKPVEATPDFDEIEGFQQAIEMILSGQHGTPNDFLYWIAQQRPQQFQVQHSDELDALVNQGILFEHQKSGAQHCLRVMEDFGVSICADAVGLGKTRLASTVAKLYRAKHEQAKIAIIAARKLHDNWERELKELGFRGNHTDYELYNKNLMSRRGTTFIEEFNRYGGPDIVIIDEAHEGIRNYKNRIHKLCLQIQERDRAAGRQRYFLLLTATPWNNNREDTVGEFIKEKSGNFRLKFHKSRLSSWRMRNSR